MKLFLLLWVLIISTQLIAKPPPIYRCKQANGTVVIQDRRCMITDLQQKNFSKSAKTNELSHKNQNKTSATKKSNNTVSDTGKALKQAQSQAQSPAKIQAKIQANKLGGSRSSQTPQTKQNTSRSPYFTFGWDRFIPEDWLQKKIETLTYQQTLLSQTQFSGLSDFKQGVELSVYANTMKSVRIDAFAQALVLYHQIRANNSFKLIDSQFKAHPHYKIFNIKYQNQQNQIMLTEFYIDEFNNDLFVVTVQAVESEWVANWRMAEQVVNRL